MKKSFILSMLLLLVFCTPALAASYSFDLGQQGVLKETAYKSNVWQSSQAEGHYFSLTSDTSKGAMRWMEKPTVGFSTYLGTSRQSSASIVFGDGTDAFAAENVAITFVGAEGMRIFGRTASGALVTGVVAAAGGTSPSRLSFGPEKIVTLIFDWDPAVGSVSYGAIDLRSVSYSTTTATPIPGIAWLVGTGLVGLLGLRRRSA